MSDTVQIDDAELVRRLQQSNASLQDELRFEREARAWEDKQKHHALKRIEELERHWADLELPMKHFEKANEP